MIIFRYLSKQTLQVMLAVTSIVLLIIMSGRFVNYLAQAANGTLQASFLFAIIGYRIPDFLVMILPLGFFLGVMLVHARLCVDHEMAVLSACGMSRHSLLKITMVPAIGVMLLVAGLSLYTAPWGLRQIDYIFAQQNALTEFDTLVGGRFQSIGGGQRATYTEGLSDDKKQMQGVFIANRDDEKSAQGTMTLLLADTAQMETSDNRRYLVLDKGVRYDLTPGALPVRETQFESYGFYMPEREVHVRANREKALPLDVLLSSNNPKHEAELQWRISLPLLIPIVVLLALPLGQVNPRQGRYAKLLPGILLYLLYLALLMNARGAMDDGRLSPSIGVWPVHGLFLCIALAFYSYEPFRLWMARKGRQK